LVQFAASIVGLFLTLASPHTSAPSIADVELWEPQIGDQVIFDTKENMGYLVHPNGTKLSFRSVSGQQRVVHYIGLTYNASTPSKDWIAKSRHIKGDRITYGPTGRFLRLYEKGDIYSHYGIHTHKYGKEFLAGDNRYRSMGCIIVSEDIFDVIEETYYLNGEHLKVATRHGLDEWMKLAMN
jgi:hypothetical protein